MSRAPVSGKKPRICFLAYHLSPNDARFLKLRAALQKNGFEVAAVAPAIGPLANGVDRLIDGPFSRFAQSMRAHSYTALVAGAFLARRRAAGLVDLVRHHRPAIILTFDPEALPTAVRAKRVTGAKLIFDAHEYHSDESPDQPKRGSWVEATERDFGPELDGFLTVNQSIANLYAQDKRITIPAMVVRNCVDPYPPPLKHDVLRKALNLPSGAPVLLYHGALQPWRGLEDLMIIAERLPRDWTVAVIGDGPLKGKIARQSQKVKLLDPVPHEELSNWVSRATLGAILYEGVGQNQRYCLPNKVWEFAAAGVPVIARDLPEIAKTLQKSGGGWLIKEGEAPEKIAAMIEGLMPDELRTAGIAARNFAVANSWERESAQFIALCRSFVEIPS